MTAVGTGASAISVLSCVPFSRRLLPQSHYFLYRRRYQQRLSAGHTLARFADREAFVTERCRDLITQPLTLDYFQKRAGEGWTLLAVEWTRQGEPALTPELVLEPEEIPYGYRVSEDCLHLIQDPMEVDVLLLILEKVVVEWQVPRIADELNLRGYRTRRGGPWAPSAVFHLLPRLIEMGPRLLKRTDWPARRRGLPAAS